MSKTIKGYYYISTGYQGSTRQVDFEIEFDDDDSEEYIDSVLKSNFNDFMSNIDRGWVIMEEIKNE